MLPPSRPDPQGYYARLGVDPAATQEAITHAFRRRALILHPDVPKTGNKDAFMALRAAYDILSNPDRRRAYDESAQQPEPPPEPVFTATHGAHDFRPNVADAPWLDEDLMPRSPGFTPRPAAPPPPERLHHLVVPILVAAGVAVVLGFGVVQAVVSFRAPAPPAPVAGIQPTAPPVVPQAPAVQRATLYGPSPVRLAGTPNYYVTPSVAPAVLWREEKDRGSVAPLAQLPPFSSVQAVRLNRQTGLVEIRYNDTLNAFIEARQLAPGDAAVARRAYCSYNAGPVPYDGEVLERRAQGTGTLQIENRAVQPMVLKLRDPKGAVALSVFLGPNGSGQVTGVPTGPLRADYAIGELWSRACNTFAAGIRARRFNTALALKGDTTLVLPTEEGVASDIPDQAFEVE
ncbi:MAG: J domain-containing protein [Acetobacteraceae bacterium]|nr:J domain-containing protein [Pseudomonadota bacterium]